MPDAQALLHADSAWPAAVVHDDRLVPHPTQVPWKTSVSVQYELHTYPFVAASNMHPSAALAETLHVPVHEAWHAVNASLAAVVHEARSVPQFGHEPV